MLELLLRRAVHPDDRRRLVDPELRMVGILHRRAYHEACGDPPPAVVPFEDPHLVLPSGHVERIAGRWGDLLEGYPGHVVVDPDVKVLAADLPGRSARRRKLDHARPHCSGLPLPAGNRQHAATGEPADAADAGRVDPALGPALVVLVEVGRRLSFDHSKNCRFVRIPFGAHAQSDQQVTLIFEIRAIIGRSKS